MSANYYRLGKLLLDGCSTLLREMFTQEAINDTRCQYINLEHYLSFHEGFIIESRCLRFTSRKELVYPSDGRKVDILQWDITLLYSLLSNLFSNPIIRAEVQEIKDKRNEFQHIATADINDDTFAKMWNYIESRAITIANSLKDKSHKKQLDDLVRDLKTLTPTTEMLNNLKKEHETFRPQIDHLTDITSGIASRINAAAHTTVNPLGADETRFKVVDSEVEFMKENLRVHVKSVVLNNSEQPMEVDAVLQKLQNEHKVVISGDDETYCLRIAVHVIMRRGYDRNHSVLLDTPKYWRRCYEQVNLVLLVNPFGTRDHYDMVRARKASEIFNQMIDASVSKKVDVIIVTHRTLLEMFKQEMKEHEMTCNEAIFQIGKQETIAEGIPSTGTTVSRKNGASVDSLVDATPVHEPTNGLKPTHTEIVASIIGGCVLTYLFSHGIIEGAVYFVLRGAFHFGRTCLQYAFGVASHVVNFLVEDVIDEIIDVFIFVMKTLMTTILKLVYICLHVIFGRATNVVILLIVAIPILELIYFRHMHI